MQWLARISVLRPTFAAVMIIALCVAGLYSYQQLGLEQMPNIDIPTIAVTTRLTGASAEEMDTSVTEEIEKQVNTISGVDSISSVSSQGVSTVTISFVMEKSSDVAYQEVQAKVNLATPNLPTDTKQSTIQKFAGDSSPILSFTLTSPDASIRDLTEYADKTLRPQIESVSGVGQATIVGGRLRQINVTLDPYRLQAYGLTAVAIKNALGQQNVEAPGGSLDQGERRVTIQAQGRFQSVQALKSLVIAQNDGQSVHLSDVANVQDDAEDTSSVARYNGQKTVLVQVQKQSGSNTVTLAEGVKNRLAELAKTMPPGYQTQVTQDQSVFVSAAVHTLEEHLILGAVLAALVVLLFLRDWRTTVIASLAIPASIIATFTLMWVKGFTLNTITMMALTLSVGIVIDDAILVLENIVRFIQEKGKDPREAALEATQEIGLAVLATTLSLVAIFLPVAFISGIVGRVLTPFGVTMSFAILVSMLVAFSLTPMLASRWLRHPEPIVHKEKVDGSEETSAATAPTHSADPPALSDKSGFYHRVEVWYWHLLRWSLGHRWVIVTLCIVTFISIIPLISRVNKEFLPTDDQSEYDISVTVPEGTSLASTGDLVEQVATNIRTSLPDVRYTVMTVGTDSQGTANKGDIAVHINDIGHRKSNETVFTMMDRVRKEILPKYPRDLTFTVAAPSAFGGGGAQPSIQYIVSGPDLTTLQNASDHLVAAVRKLPGVADISSSVASGSPEALLTIDRAHAADLGVSAENLTDTVQIVAAGENVSSYEEGGRRYDINLRSAPQYRSSVNGLRLFNVPSTKSGLSAVTLDQVATFQNSTAASAIDRYNRTRQITLSVDITTGASSSQVQQEIDQTFHALNLGPQYQGQLGGISREQGKAFSSFGVIVLLSFIFVYLILAAQFESWIHPITILIALPLSVPFGLLALLVSGSSLNIYSLLGLLVLFGVVKKNSILQVDHANQLRAEGQPREDAILNASRDRLRPILMTTLAFVAGMLPLAVSQGVGASTNHSVGYLIIGGQTLALGLTLVATPVFYSLMDDFIQGFGRFRSRLASRFQRPSRRSQVSPLPLPIPPTAEGTGDSFTDASVPADAPERDLTKV